MRNELLFFVFCSRCINNKNDPSILLGINAGNHPHRGVKKKKGWKGRRNYDTWSRSMTGSISYARIRYKRTCRVGDTGDVLKNSSVLTRVARLTLLPVIEYNSELKDPIVY